MSNKSKPKTEPPLLTAKEPEITVTIGENAFLEMRLKQLQAELQEGANLIAPLETRLRNVRESLFRIDGAITVLQERQFALASSENGEAEETSSKQEADHDS